MISLRTYREYYEDVMRRVPGIHSVRVVNVDQDMSDCLKSISSDELPVLFVVVPSACMDLNLIITNKPLILCILQPVMYNRLQFRR